MGGGARARTFVPNAFGATEIQRRMLETSAWDAVAPKGGCHAATLWLAEFAFWFGTYVYAMGIGACMSVFVPEDVFLIFSGGLSAFGFVVSMVGGLTCLYMRDPRRRMTVRGYGGSDDEDDDDDEEGNARL